MPDNSSGLDSDSFHYTGSDERMETVGQRVQRLNPQA
jgi:hypothetical protein